MPSRLPAPVLQVDAAKLHKLDTKNVQNLFAMWTVFNKCAESMEEGRRLENLSWRLWNRETFCCESSKMKSSTPLIVVKSKKTSRQGSDGVPALSSSVESAIDDEIEEERIEELPQHHINGLDITSKRPALHRVDSSSSGGQEKHLTSYDLEKLVMTIKEQKALPSPPAVPKKADVAHAAPQPSTLINGSTETASTLLITPESDRPDEQACGSETSAGSALSGHSIVRGFGNGKISSYRSQSHLAPPPSPQPNSSAMKIDDANHKKKESRFLIGGGSSGEDESSLDSNMSSKMKPSPQPQRSSLTKGIRASACKKQASFAVVEPQIIEDRKHEPEHEHEAVFESDEDESAIEDDDESDWEDSATDSGESSVVEKPTFPRVDSTRNLTSRRSALTTLMHQGDRQAAFEKQASRMLPRSTSAVHRSRTTSPNGPSVAGSPDEEVALTMRTPTATRAQPIIVTTSNTHQPALSPRTTRRNMLHSELSESLRKHIITERHSKQTNTAAVLKRRHTSHDVVNLQEYPGKSLSSREASKNNSWNNYFEDSVGGYNSKGW